MKVETKFDIGDRVFWMKNNKVEENIITDIEIKVGLKEEDGMINYDNIKAFIKSEIYYVDMNRDLKFHPRWLFKTKEELLNSL
jgi:predicted membrane-bound dolichyl-phosphate-mannose-protein mannosyltransferase